MNTKRIMVMFVFTLAIMGYAVLRYVDYRTQQRLLNVFAPIDQACQSEAGCPLIPQGWRAQPCEGLQAATDLASCASPPAGSPYQTLLYQANTLRFTARWPYLTDAEITITGGKGQTMTLQEK